MSFPGSLERFDKKKHSREGFACGEPSLDFFLQQLAGQQQSRNQAVTYVYVEKGRILGYFTLSAYSLLKPELEGARAAKEPYERVPALMLGRLARDLSMKGKRSEGGVSFGTFLLLAAMRKAAQLSLELGAVFLVLEALNEIAAKFYHSTGFGFEALPDHPLKLVLELKHLQKQFGVL